MTFRVECSRAVGAISGTSGCVYRNDRVSERGVASNSATVLGLVTGDGAVVNHQRALTPEAAAGTEAAGGCVVCDRTIGETPSGSVVSAAATRRALPQSASTSG